MKVNTDIKYKSNNKNSNYNLNGNLVKDFKIIEKVLIQHIVLLHRLQQDRSSITHNQCNEKIVQPST